MEELFRSFSREENTGSVLGSILDVEGKEDGAERGCEVRNDPSQTNIKSLSWHFS